MFKKNSNGELNRVDQYLLKLLAKGMTPCKEGEHYFRWYSPALDATGLLLRRYYTKAQRGKKFLILQWDVESTEGRGPNRIRTTTRFVQGYHAFDCRQIRDSAFLIMEDLGVTV